MKQLANFDREDFLANYWQQKPLLIRQAIPGFNNPISPDELAGLACEDDIESRLIVGSGEQWQLSHGPLDDSHFQALPETEWTLLVQAVDHWMPEVAELIDYVNFIPSWRIDDVMVSYASEGGSVGPHYDNYDVFLVQGLGQRRWQIGQYCKEQEPLLANEHLKIIKQFELQQEFLLNPGDILYLPPRFAHWGVGVGEDCMTYSIGFRAPDHGEILANFCDYQLSQLNEQQRYQDPNLPNLCQPGEIQATAIAQVKTILQQLCSDEGAITRWFGQYMTEPKYVNLHEEEEQGLDWHEVVKALSAQEFVYRNPASRFAFVIHDESMVFFVDGQSYNIDHSCHAHILTLCKQRQYHSNLIETMLNTERCKEIILTLFNNGALFFYEQDNN